MLSKYIQQIKNNIKINGRYVSSITYNENGHPFNVLRIENKETTLPKPGPNQVTLKFLAAPINPADINMIEGGYGIKPTFPAIGGNEGVALITDVGSNVKNIKVNDHVIPSIPGFGTWRKFALAEAKDMNKISKKIPIEYAATLAVNPCTAYRLLQDFETLKEGDVIVQNGASSSVGRAVIQLAAMRGIKTINIVRNDSEYAFINDHLKGLGGTIVCVPEYVATPDFKKLISDLPAPKLGLNCIGGKLATNVARMLGPNATLVTYGGMSREPVIIPTSLLIFKNLKLSGFWLTEWIKRHSATERQEMLDILAKLMEEKKLRTWIETYKFSKFHDAMAAVINKTTKRKVVLLMDK